jgi:outer membrane protein assembly factor BamB
MQIMRCVSFFVVILLASSCEREEVSSIRTDAEGVITNMSYVWTSPLSDGELIPGGIRPSLVWNEYVLFGGYIDGKQVLHMKHSEDGSTLWQWSDHLMEGEELDIRDYHQYKDHLTVSQGSRAYGINLATGNTEWRTQTDTDLGALIKGIGNRYFLSEEITNSDGHLEAIVTVGDVRTGQQREFVRPPYTYEYVNPLNRISYLHSLELFTDSAGDTLMIVTYGNGLPDWKADNFLGLYNLTQKDWVYVDKPITKNSIFGAGTLAFSKLKYRVYLQAGKKLFCYEVATGEKQWEQSFAQGFSDIIVVENKVLANSEDTYLYALDTETGRQVWEEKSSGTSSPMAYLDGVVYFTGGGDGLLHAVEVATGKHLWKIQSPDLEKNSGAWFKRHVAVIPATEAGQKGKVLTSSYLSAFCYEAAR